MVFSKSDILVRADRLCARLLQSKLLFAVFIFKILVLVFIQARYSSDFPVTNFFDNDGSNTLYVITRTNLWNSNGWWPYGPVYYRLAYILNNVSLYKGLSSLSLKQEYIYFTSVLISLFACLASFFVVFRLLWKDGRYLPLCNLTFIAFFLMLVSSDRPFYYFLLMPHPDYLLALLVVLSFYFSILYIEKEHSKKMLFLAAMSIGIALSTKLSSIYFALSLLAGFLFVFGLNQKSFRIIFSAIGVAICTYFFVGFPQNFQLHKLYGFLSNQTRYHLPPDLSSVKTWFYHLLRNVIPFVPVIFCLRFSSVSQAGLKFLGLSFIISFGLLIGTVNTKMEAGHYVFPYFFLFLLLLFVLKNTFWNLKSNTVLLGITLGVIFWPIPDFFSSMIEQKDNCRGEIKRTLKFLENHVGNYDEVLIDAYAPYQPKDMRGMKSIWSLRPEIFTKRKTLFAINWLYAGVFLGEPNAFYAENNPDWAANQKFYTTLKNTNAFHDQGVSFKRLMINDCGLEVWEALK